MQKKIKQMFFYSTMFFLLLFVKFSCANDQLQECKPKENFIHFNSSDVILFPGNRKDFNFFDIIFQHCNNKRLEVKADQHIVILKAVNDPTKTLTMMPALAIEQLDTKNNSVSPGRLLSTVEEGVFISEDNIMKLALSINPSSEDTLKSIYPGQYKGSFNLLITMPKSDSKGASTEVEETTTLAVNIDITIIQSTCSISINKPQLFDNTDNTYFYNIDFGEISLNDTNLPNAVISSENFDITFNKCAYSHPTVTFESILKQDFIETINKDNKKHAGLNIKLKILNNGNGNNGYINFNTPITVNNPGDFKKLNIKADLIKANNNIIPGEFEANTTVTFNYL